MTRHTYLAHSTVQRFIQWLELRIESDEFAHSWLNRRTGERWFCNNLYHAFQNYEWRFEVPLPTGSSLSGKSFNESSAVLGTISVNLKNAVNSDNDADTLAWSLAVMRWGGVFSSNGAWLKAHEVGIAERLRKNVLIFTNVNTDNNMLSNIERFNSGMTKLYSLLANNFIIYDTRVAAALGWLVTRFCIHYGLKQVPLPLQFPYGMAKEATNTPSPKQRNPSLGPLLFPRLYSGPAHAWANLRSSWLLQQVCENARNSRFKREQQPLRAIEAALFMFGYDLGTSTHSNLSIPSQKPRSDTVHASDEISQPHDDFFRLKTRGGRQRVFGVRINDGSLTIENIDHRIDVFEFKELHWILTELHQQFSIDWFPLANNVQKMGNGTERPGLGCTILKNKPGNISHAQAASYLGRVLEDLDFVQWNGRTRGIAWKLLKPPPSLAELTDFLLHLPKI